MQGFVVLKSTFLEITCKEKTHKKQQINFQNTGLTITKRQTKLELVFLYFCLKEDQNQNVFLFWFICIFILIQKKNVWPPVLSIFPLSRERDTDKGGVEPSTPNVTT